MLLPLFNLTNINVPGHLATIWLSVRSIGPLMWRLTFQAELLCFFTTQAYNRVFNIEMRCVSYYLEIPPNDRRRHQLSALKYTGRCSTRQYIWNYYIYVCWRSVTRAADHSLRDEHMTSSMTLPVKQRGVLRWTYFQCGYLNGIQILQSKPSVKCLEFRY